MSETAVVSFVLRFVQETAQGEPPGEAAWYGYIRHVQSDEELRFIDMADALRFVARYVGPAGIFPAPAEPRP